MSIDTAVTAFLAILMIGSYLVYRCWPVKLVYQDQRIKN